MFPLTLLPSAMKRFIPISREARSIIEEAKDFTVIDVGGGSTEIIAGGENHFQDFVSVPMGSVKLTEMFIRHDPPSDDEIRSLRNYIRGVLKVPFMRKGGLLVGTAGNHNKPCKSQPRSSRVRQDTDPWPRA